MPYPETTGTAGEYIIQLRQRMSRPDDPYQGGSGGGSVYVPGTVTTIVAVKGSAVTELSVFFSSTDAANHAQTVLRALQALGAQVVFGNPTAPIPVAVGSKDLFTKAVVLAPGTPLPPCRNVQISAGGGADLVLANGGTYRFDADAGSTRMMTNALVVDATNVKPGTTITFLY